MSSIILFNNASANIDSPTFELIDGQLTIVAVGMQPGDYITFELVKVASGSRSTVCGCRLTDARGAVIDGVQQLQCPNCDNGETPQPVRLTFGNPVVILDSPQDSLLRAIYHGEGLEMRTVTVWAEQTDTPNLTEAMRGCPPLCCVDTTWSPTGFRRCMDGMVEIEEISNCGTHRWTEYCEVSWTDTGATRCEGNFLEREQRNQCNATRWFPYEPLTWTGTGVTRCEGGFFQQQEVNNCGTTRWNNGVPVTWTVTSNSRCQGGFFQRQEVDNCGNTRWNAGVAITWTPTGNIRCGTVQFEREEVDNCGNLRWVNGGTNDWTDTGATRCTELAYEREQQNACGGRRWVTTSNLTWTPTGLYDCRSNVNWRQEANQCGTTRWINTGAACGDSSPSMTSLTPTSANVVEGQLACWNFVLSAPVIGAPLTVEFDLSGPDFVRNGYITPRTVLVPTGASSGQLCILTTDDLVVDGDERLCVTPRVSPRLTSVPGVSCILVLDNDANPYNVTTITQTTPNPIIEGQTVCWEVTVSRPVETNPLVLGVVWGGADNVRNNYPNGSVTIAVGQTKGNLCIATTDDLDIDGTEALCIASFVPNPRLAGVPGTLPCVDVLDNDVLPPGDSTHTVVSIVPVNGDITEGQQACWVVTLNSPVANSNLLMSFGLSGADQVRHGYPPPTLTIPIGQSSGTVCVTTFDDVVVDGTEQLCITAITSARITGVPAASCINVNDNDVNASVHTITCVNPPATATEGALVCWTVELSSPVAVSPLVVSGVLSGSEQSVHGYASPSITIPVGQSSGTLCVQTTDDLLVEGTKQLCLTISTSARITSVNDVPCFTPPGGTLPPASWGGNYPCAFRSSNHDAASRSWITFLPDGTWNVKRGGIGGVGGSGPPVQTGNGTWITGAFNPADYEIRFSGNLHEQTDTTGSSPTCLEAEFTDTNTPFDSGWLVLNAIREDEVQSPHAIAAGYCNSSETLGEKTTLIQIRKISDQADAVSATANMCAEATSFTSPPAGGGGL